MKSVLKAVVPSSGLLFVAALALGGLPSWMPVGLADSKTVGPSEGQGRITQVSVINALMIGRYDGVMPMGELLQLGDFGIGTLDHLDGEMLVLDGHAYQVRGDGKVLDVGPDRSTPFAVMARFKEDGKVSCQKVSSLSDLEARLDSGLKRRNNFLAVRAEGRFSSITLRSVKRQEPPYRPLGEVAKTQSVWTYENVSGTLVGFRCPAWVKGLNVPGYHWHFLSDDRKVGGHVLDCRTDEARVKYHIGTDWQIKLDDSDAFNEENLGVDLSRDLHRVESLRGVEPATEAKDARKDEPKRP